MHTSKIEPSATRAGRCLGCPDCKGMCRALMELVSLPEVVLAHHTPAR